MMIGLRALATAVLAAWVATAAGGGLAQEVKLPQSLTATAYDTGTSGFNIAVAVGKALKDKYGTDLRVLPAGNDVARLNPVRMKRAQISAMGIGIYFAQEGMFEFAVKEWGPQRLQLILSSTDCNGIGYGVAKDTGVREPKDLRGRRVGVVVGSPALNQNAFAFLAFGGLSTSDVRLVEFSSFGAMWKGMMNNEADAAIASTITSTARELETSPRGLVWMSTPHKDAAGWARTLKVAPYFVPHVATCGAGGLTAQNGLEMPGYPYPIFMAYADQDGQLVYSIAKAMIGEYEAYKDSAPGASGLGLRFQNLKWVIPYHAGSIRALKEAGIWKAEHDAYNDALLQRQDVLVTAWTAYVKSAPEDKDAFRTGWMSARKASLTKAGLDPVFE